MNVCRTIGCDDLVQEGHPGEKAGLCFRCWEEINALEEMRKRKNEARRKD